MLTKALNTDKLILGISKYRFLTWCVILCISFCACKGDKNINTIQKSQIVESKTELPSKISIHNHEENWAFSYDLSKYEKCVLPIELIEISGLTRDSNTGITYAINDEKAIIYTVEDCKVISRFQFGKKGDYEGIEKIGNDVYVLKSNGNITQYDLNNESIKQVIKTPLKTKNDSEGLGFDAKNNSLLIACKGAPYFEKKSKDKKIKAVYSLHLENYEFVDKPLFVIDDDEIEQFYNRHYKKQFSRKEAKKKLKRALDFSPSAIAKSPVDHYLYILSTVGKTILVVNEEYDIVSLQFLDHSQFIQPEGICFDSSGDMFISNEGKNLIGNILKFRML